MYVNIHLNIDLYTMYLKIHHVPQHTLSRHTTTLNTHSASQQTLCI
jgi:hypothetical protein